jgi:hypothetical protein
MFFRFKQLLYELGRLANVKLAEQTPAFAGVEGD